MSAIAFEIGLRQKKRRNHCAINVVKSTKDEADVTELKINKITNNHEQDETKLELLRYFAACAALDGLFLVLSVAFISNLRF